MPNRIRPLLQPQRSHSGQRVCPRMIGRLRQHLARLGLGRLEVSGGDQTAGGPQPGGYIGVAAGLVGHAGSVSAILQISFH